MPAETTYNANQIPMGVDRADGLEGRLGTATPTSPAAVDIQSALGAVITVEEFPDSPTIERAEQGTYSHKFRMSWAAALTQLESLGRATTWEDSEGNQYKVLSSQVQHQPGGVGILTVVSESLSIDTPWDEFSLTPVELGIHILKHPRYFYALNGNDPLTMKERPDKKILNQQVIRLLQEYFETTTQTKRDRVIFCLNLSFDNEDVSDDDPVIPDVVSGTNEAKAAALEIIQKYWLGVETPYIVGWQITWSQYSYELPQINPGGYIEEPTEASPPLPDYFATTGDGDPPDSIFKYMYLLNPTCYSSTGAADGKTQLSWLRKADQVERQRTWYKITRTWIGSPVGYWDPKIYSQDPRPITIGEYEEVDPTFPPKL